MTEPVDSLKDRFESIPTMHGVDVANCLTGGNADTLDRYASRATAFFDPFSGVEIADEQNTDLSLSQADFGGYDG